jgi:iron complex outermembrane receptor protein
MNTLKKVLGGVGAVIVLAHGPELALGAVLAAASDTASPTTDAASPTSATADGALEEIVVTADKRVESAQRAPLAVTSVSGSDLAAAHVSGVDDLFRVVPNVQVDVGGSTGDPGGSSAQFTIRGLGASATGPQGSSGVAVHFDGVFRQNGLSNGEFYDLQRVEVDPGPQGTLYGRSAAAGAVNVIPNAPTHEFGAEATLEAGNYSEVRTAAMLNLPINDIFAVRGAFQSIKHDGYFSNGYDDEHTQSGRFQALLTPSADLSIRLYTDYTHIGGVGASGVFVGVPGIAQLTQLFPQLTSANIRGQSIAQYCAVDGTIVDTCGQQVDVTKWSAHFDASYNLGWGVITVLPAFNAQNEHAEHSNAPLPLSNYANAPYDQNETSLEMRLSDPGTSQFKWVGGFNYFYNHVYDVVNQDINILAPLATPVGPLPGLVSISSVDEFAASQKSYAAFGQLVYPVLDWLRVTAGARYNHDSATYDGELATNSQQVYLLNGPLLATPVPSPIGTGPLSSAVSFNAVTYRFAVDADVGPNSIVYGSAGTGYKPGGLNDGGPASTNTPAQLALLSAQTGASPAELEKLAPSQSFGPEKVLHFEIGSKNRFLNNRLEINDALYLDNYKNYQNGDTQVVNPLLFQTQGFVITNAGKSRVYGNELSVKYQLAPADLVTASINYLRAYFTSYIAPAYLSANGVVPAQDFAGGVLPSAPLFSANLSYTHTFTLSDGGHVAAGLYTHLTDGYWTYFAESPGTYQPHYTTTTADLTWTSSTGRWSVSAFGKNLENKNIETFGQLTTAYTEVHLNAPRTYGASVTAKVF